MNVVITPKKLTGTVKIPASKSMAHRAIICAALAEGISHLQQVNISRDIMATLSVMEAFGASYEIQGNTLTIQGISAPAEQAEADCCESGSTLRFLIPVAAALGISATFHGQGRLPKRPITPYLRELSRKGITFQNTVLPFTLTGQLQSGTFQLEGDISSQFVTGLLFALPLLPDASTIQMLSPLQSEPYVNMTIACMQQAGVLVEKTPSGYHIPGGQQYQPLTMAIEGDFSQAAFFYVANALGNKITLENIPETSAQGDRQIVDLLQETAQTRESPICISARDIPDLVPILAVWASFSDRVVRIIEAERLRIKESDRLETTAAALRALGGRVIVYPDGLEIHPVAKFHGGIVDSAGDHRIAMCAAIAATRADAPVTILGAECVEKSYPAFWNVYQTLGGDLHGINLE